MINLFSQVSEKIQGVISDAGQFLEVKSLLYAYKKEAGGAYFDIEAKNLVAGRAVLEADPHLQVQILITLLGARRDDYELIPLKNTLLARKLPWTTEELESLLEQRQRSPAVSISDVLRPLQHFKNQGNALTPKMEVALRVMLLPLSQDIYSGARQVAFRVMALLGEETYMMPDAGETWADAALSDLSTFSALERSAWEKLFAKALNSETSKPSTHWRKEARTLVAEIGEEGFRVHLVKWFGLVSVPPMKTHRHEYAGGGVYESQVSSGSSRNLSLLKGLAWMCADFKEIEVARALAKLVEAGLRKQPGVGPWAVRAVNAAIWALTEMDSSEAVGQLSRLKTKVTFRTALNGIEKGLEIAAKRAGVTKADLEDLSVPTYGFDLDGTRREAFGESSGVATLTSTGEITLAWFAANDKPVKAPSADAKKNFATELKQFKADVDAASKMLTAQKARFDGFYLPERVWTLKNWRERFGSHPLLSNITSRLILHFSYAEQKAQGLWSVEKGGFADVEGNLIEWLTEEAEVRLWHPIGFAVEEVLAWRDALQKAGIAQPFKQAYREVYLLTEAELRTETYSNRFAGHILKQHQMNTLAAVRGWQNKLRLMVDNAYPPALRELPELGLRAEFWIEGIGDDYGTDTTESGSYLHLNTDQVRFYRMDAPINYAHANGGGYSLGWGANRQPEAALPLTEVPALAFSEIMRDVDLFVGVCSVGNDPTWQDGGPQGQYQDYWTNYSFGDLSATAKTRSDVLRRLLPRLKIADRCSLTEKFLVVRGDIRTYKIHLGSGNILMEPNDQYLCIVQDRNVKNEVQTGFLPFEGDQRLALILSKALLLADDRKITDVTITRQIGR